MLGITRYSVKNECITPWIKFIWHFETQEADIHYKLLPTDCIDVILNLSGDMVYETEQERMLAPSLHVNGLRRKHSYIHQTGNVQVYGISCNACGLYPFIQKSLIEIQDRIVNLWELSSPLARQLELAISHGGSTEETIQNIEIALCHELQFRNTYVNQARMISQYLDLDYEITLQEFCFKHQIQPKTFTRNVLRCTGYPPHILRAVRRFQTAGNQLVFEKSEPLSGIAYGNHFADQAHFTRTFKTFSGAAPRVFLQEQITVKENTTYKYE